MITGTMIAGIMGLSRWESPADVWLRAKGLKQIEVNEAMEIGLLLEPILGGWYEEEVGSFEKPGLLVWEKNPNFGGHPDGIDLRNRRIVEFKTTRKLNGCTVEWNCQVQWYMMLSDMKEAYVYAAELPSLSLEQFRALLDDGFDLRKIITRKVYRVERDDVFLEQARAQAEQFLELLERDEPPEEWSIPADIRYPKGSGVVKANEGIVDKWRRLKELNEELKAINKEKELIIEEIKEFMREHSELIFENELLATWREEERVTVDAKRLKAEQPQIFERYAKKSTSRVFSVK